jgi:tetratricopeptide (TPR) repeat protein
LDRAIALEPNVATLYVNRCDVHNARADRKSALADIDRALKIDPTTAPYYLVKFALLGELEKFDEAADVVTEALRRCPEDSANLHAARAHARASKKDHAGTLADLDVAVREAPDNVTYRWMRVEVLAFCPDPAVRNRDRAAAEAAAVAEQPGGKDAESLRRVAFYYDLAGRAADAERWRARAGKLKPPPPPAADLPPLPK